MGGSSKNGSDGRKIVSMAFFSSALAFASRSAHGTWLEDVMLAGAFFLFGVCITMLIRAVRGQNRDKDKGKNKNKKKNNR